MFRRTCGDELVCVLPMHTRLRVRPASGIPCALCLRAVLSKTRTLIVARMRTRASSSLRAKRSNPFLRLRCNGLLRRAAPRNDEMVLTIELELAVSAPAPPSRPHGVPRDHVAIERCAQLRDALLRLEIHVIEPEALLEAEDPLEIVHQAPEEIAAHRSALGDGALQLHQVIAQVHDAVEVIDLAVGGDLVVGG